MQQGNVQDLTNQVEALKTALANKQTELTVSTKVNELTKQKQDEINQKIHRN